MFYATLLLFTLLLATSQSAPLPQCNSDVLVPTVGVTSGQSGIQTITAGDVDGDGDADLVVAMSVSDRVLWFNNTDGAGTWTEHTITASGADGANGVALGDADGDGDTDVFVAASLASDVLLFINSDGRGTFVPAAAPAVTGVFQAKAIAVGDFDADGDVDLVVGIYLNIKVAWYANNGSGTFGSENVMSTGLYTPISVDVGLVDADTYPDVVVAYLTTKLIALFVNSPASPGNFSNRVDIDTSANAIASVRLADLNGDGRVDIFSPHSNALHWYENTGNGMFGDHHVVLGPTVTAAAQSAEAADVTGDGVIDVVVLYATPLQLNVYQGIEPGSNAFLPGRTITTFPSSPAPDLALADFNGDGRADVAFGPSPSAVEWADAAIEAQPPAYLTTTFVSTTTTSPSHVAPVDVDADGDADLVVVSASSRTVYVFINTDGAGTYALPYVAYNNAGFFDPVAAHPADVDNDGDADLVLSSGIQAEFVVVLNTDGAGTFDDGTAFPLAFAARVTLGDIDGDGNVDVMASTGFFGIHVLLGTGAGGFGSPIVTSVLADYVTIFDIDGDGDLDAVLTSWSSMTWVANVGGGTFDTGTPHALPSTGSFTHLTHGECTGDGRPDVLSATSSDIELAIHPGGDGTGVWTTVSVATGLATVRTLSASDMDGDGTTDVLVSTSGDNRVTVIRNIGGSGTAWTPLIVTSAVGGGTGAVAVDIDRDGDVDVAWVSSSTNQIGIDFLSHRTAFAPLHSRVIAYDNTSLACIDPQSFACLAHNIAQTSLCVRDTLELPPGTYGCRRDAHYKLTQPLKLAAQVPGTVEFACSGGVLFRLERHPQVLIETSGDLVMAEMTIRGLGVARASLFGSPGLRVVGGGSSLTLSHVVVSDASTASTAGPTLVVDAGLAGAVMARDGGAVALSWVTMTECEAGQSGGAVAVRGTGASVVAENTVFSANSAALGGGAVVVLEGGELAAIATTFTNNVAGRGSGGGVLVDSSSSATLGGCMVSGNAAVGGVGGGVGVHAGGNVSIDASTCSGNTAFGGGCIGSVPVGIEAAVIVQAVFEMPSGTSGGSGRVALNATSVAGNVALGYGGGAFVCGGEVRVGGGVWSGNVAERAGVLGSSHVVFVCNGSGVPVVEGSVDGVSVHGPVAVLLWVAAPAPRMQAGRWLEGKLEARDVFGARVSYSRSSVVVAYAADARAVPPSAATTGLGDGVVVLPEARVRTRGTGEEFELGWSVGPAVASSGVATLTGSVLVTACARDFGLSTVVVADVGEANECNACVAGTYSPVSSFEPCLAIEPCATGAVDVLGLNATFPVCVCDSGWHVVGTRSNGQPLCAPCPRGAVCRRGLERPEPARGYFGTANATFVACLRPNACPGGPSRECAPAYEGYMCNKCAAGHYSDALRDCVVCPENSMMTLAVGVGAVAIGCVAAAGVIGLGLGRAVGQSGTTKGGLRKRRVPASLSMIVVAAQVIGILATTRMAWAEGSQSALSAFAVFNIDSNLFATECSLSSFHFKYAFSVGLPLGIMAVVVALLVGLRTCWAPLQGASVLTMADGVAFTLVPLLFIPVASAVIVLFDCTQLPDGSFVLDVDPGVQCGDEAWLMVLPVGLAGVATYVVGLPAYFLRCLMQHADSLLEPHVFARYGGMYKLYRMVYFWGGIADLGKRLVIVAAVTFASDHQLVQLAVLITLLVGSSLAVVHFRPYYYPLYNELDVRINVVLFVVLTLGFASLSERNADSEQTQTAIFVLLVSVLFLFVGVAVHAVVVDMRQIVSASRKVYSTGADRATRLAATLSGEVADLDAEELQILRQVLDDAGAGGRRRETALGWNLSEGSTTSSESLSSESGGREEEQGGEDRPGSGVSFSDFVEPV